MAIAHNYVCQECGRSLLAWSDANPYYYDEQGVKQYAHHPNHDLLDLCIGVDIPHLCLKCGHKAMVDSRAPFTACPSCQAKALVRTTDLFGKPCPCGAGTFSCDFDDFAIS